MIDKIVSRVKKPLLIDLLVVGLLAVFLVASCQPAFALDSYVLGKTGYNRPQLVDYNEMKEFHRQVMVSDSLQKKLLDNGYVGVAYQNAPYGYPLNFLCFSKRTVHCLPNNYAELPLLFTNMYLVHKDGRHTLIMSKGFYSEIGYYYPVKLNDTVKEVKPQEPVKKSSTSKPKITSKADGNLTIIEYNYTY